MFGLRSARGRATFVGLLLAVFLVGVTAFTVWQTQSDNRQLHRLEQASDTAAALEHARAQLYLQTSLLSALALSQDAGLADRYLQAQGALEQDLIQARADATQRGDEVQLAVLDDLAVRMAGLEATANLAIPLLLQSDAPTAMELTASYLPSVRDVTDAMFADLDQLAQNGRTNLAAERAAMDSDADVTFWLIIARGVAAFVLTAGIATVVLLSILRPLAALRLSARAIAAGNLNARARAYGPEEVASLARDFNRMTDALSVKTEEYVTTTNLTGDIIGKLDAENRWTFLNDAACQFYGKPRERLLGTDAGATLHPEDLESTARVLQEARTSKEPRNDLVNRVVTPLGTRVVEWNAYPLFDKGGGDAGFQITGRDITERNRVQEALRESEARYRLLAENTTDLIWTMDLSLRYTYVSPAVTRMRGYSVEEIVGTTVQETMTPASLEVARKILAEQLVLERDGGADPNRSAKLDLEMYCKDGSTIWTEMNMTFLRGADGRPVGILGVTRDITGRKRAEEELLRQGAVLGVINRVLRETLSCETDADVARVCIEEAQKLTSSDFGFIGEVNQAGRFDTIALTDPGWEACRMPRSSGVRMIKDMELRGIWSKVLRDERPVIVNDPASHPDGVGTPEGHPPLTSFLGVPLKHRGKTIGMIGLANKASGYDVADQENVEAISTAFVEALSRKRAEGALEESERRYRLIAENATDLIWTTDMSLRYTYISPSVLRLRGYSVEEAMAHTVEQDLCPSSLDVAMKTLAEEVARAGSDEKVPYRWQTLELEHFCKDGSTVWLEVTTTFLRDEDGRPVGLLGSSRDISERKQAKEALEESERRYRLIAENSTDVIWSTDLSFRYTYVSPSVTRLRGYSVEEVMASSFKETLPPGSLDTARKMLAEALAQNSRRAAEPFESRAVELELNRKDGSTVWAEIQVTFLRDSDGKPVGIMGVTRDISERKRAEEALEESERRYRLLAENASDIIWTMDMNLRFTYESPAVTRIRGYTPEEAMALTIEETLTPASLEVARKALAEELVPEKMGSGDLSRSRTLELEHTCKDGCTVWLEVTTAFLRDEDGRPVGLLGASRDISERKRAEEALEESKGRYRLLAENVSDVIFTTDLSMRYTYVSPSVTRMRGYSVEEVMAGTLAESLTPASLEVARKAIGEQLAKEAAGERNLPPSRTVEVELNCKDGSTIWAEVTASFLRNPDGQPIGLLGVSRDVTERKRAEEERKRLHAELETRAVTDSLTGLHNHAYFYERLADEIDRSRRYGHRFALVMMDVDAFKHYNDSRGHQAGDAALRLVGECVRSAMRRSDMAFRYGGDEFVAILLNAEVSKAQDIVRRINRRITARLKEQGDSAGAWLGLSAGVACFPDDATTVDELVRMADTAMYDAKRLAWARGVMGRGQAVESAACPVDTLHETQTGTLASAASSLAEALQDLTPPEMVAGSDLRTIAALGAAAEIKDPFIRGHQERTSRLAATVAKEMGLSVERVRNITTAGLVHDLGKFSVGESILTKPGKLTESEYAKMKEHSTLGANMIVSGAEALQPLAPIVRHHHERFDGSGYPDGLARENIPLEARILGVADAFDAMTHERSYRKALSTAEALGEIERGAGTRFDRAVVEAFLGIVRRRGGEPG